MQNQRASAVQLRLITGGADSPQSDVSSSGVRYKVEDSNQSVTPRHGRLIDKQGQVILPGMEKVIANPTATVINETRQALLPGFNQHYDYNDLRNYSSTSAAFANFAQRVISGTSDIAVVDEVKDFPTRPLIENGRLTLDPQTDRLNIENLEIPTEELGDNELDSFLRSASDRKMALVVDEKLRLVDYLDELSLQENDRNEKKRQYEETLQYRGSRLKNLGKALAGAVKSVVTAVPRAIDALLPDSLQVTPKIEIFEGLRRQKEDELKKLELQYQKDLREIRSSYDSIAEYVKDNYGKSVPRFDTNDELMLNNLVVECKFEEDSPHFKAVQELVEKRIKRRAEQHDLDLSAIMGNNASRENMDEMLKDSWLLRTREKIRNALTPAKKPLPVATPLRRPSINSAGNTTVNQGGGNEPPKTPDKRLFWSRASAIVAGAVALGLGILVGPNSFDRSSDEFPLPTASANGKDNLPDPSASVKTTTEKPEQIKETDQPAKPKVVKPVTTPAPQPEIVSQVRNRQVDRKNNQTVHPQPAKTQKVTSTVIPTPADKALPTSPAPDTAKPQTKAEQPAVTTLTENDRISELKMVEAKVSAYKRRLSEIETDAKLLKPLIATRNIDLHLDSVTPLLDSVLTQMKSLKTAQDRDNVNSTIKSIDQIMAEAENTVKLVNVAEAMIPQGHAQKLLDETKRLTGSATARFSIIHQSNSGSAPTINQYQVNLAEIQSKLAAINQSLQNHEGMTLYQSRMARLDAEYWVGYLKFVNWYLQFDKTQVIASK
jgi:hypothetical protein